MRPKNLSGTLAIILAIASFALANPIPQPPDVNMPFEHISVDIQPDGEQLRAVFSGKFTFDWISESVEKMQFPVLPDTNNIGVWMNDTPVSWQWSDKLYEHGIWEIPEMPLFEWYEPFPESGGTLRIEYDHALLEWPGEFVYFYPFHFRSKSGIGGVITTVEVEIQLPSDFTLRHVGLWYPGVILHPWVISQEFSEYSVTDSQLTMTIDSRYEPDGYGFAGGFNLFFAARTLYVAPGGDDVIGTGTRKKPFRTIQRAIDLAVDGVVITVADGTYTGEGNRDIDFKGKAITVRSENGPENCIIDCNGLGRGFYFQSGEDANSILAGFTITNGYDGGIRCLRSSPVITGCIIIDNEGSFGAGISCLEGRPTITNCTISGNTARGDGGGIYCNYKSSPTITNCIINGNSSYGRYGGGGMFFEDSSPTITNCIIWGNVADQDPQLSASTNPAYSCIQNWGGGGQGNIFYDPCFIEPGFWADANDPNIVVEPNNPNAIWIQGDYHLLVDSPCIDAGDPNFVPGPNETDLDGRPRIIGAAIDMGAYEFNHIPIADAGPNQVVYAWIDWIAQATLDGSGSYDEDGQPLTYLWSWTVDGNTYDANGIFPTIERPVGEYTIELIVNDGIDDSKPNWAVITVIEPVESRLWIFPRIINRYSRQKKMMAWLRLPGGLTKDQIDSGQPLLLYPGGIEATRQFVFQHHRRRAARYTSIFAFFDKAELMNAVADNVRVELQVVGQLKTGQYFYGSDTIRIISRRRR